MVRDSLLRNGYCRKVVVMIDDTNYVIYHRNNSTLGLTNHIDKDGDLDPNYSLLRNTGLTGNKKRFKWLTECASNGCPICSGIFEPNNSNWKIKEWYVVNVVNPLLENRKLRKVGTLKEKKWLEKPNSQVNALQEIFARSRKQNKDEHPLLDKIRAKFLKGE